ncbi:MAG: hypothetical protein AAGF85_05960 [Bacteroidota bacterium]
MKVIRLFFILFFAMLVACDDDNDEMEIIPVNDVACEEDGVTFLATGQHGENILRDANSEIDTLKVNGFTNLSLQASTSASCTDLKITVTNITADCENCMILFLFEDSNWEISDYNAANKSQTFTSTGMEMDMQFFGISGGTYQIDYFVNDSISHTNYLQSSEDNLEVFLQNEPVSSFSEGNSALYVVSVSISGPDGEYYYGIMDVDNPDAGVTNKFIGGSEITTAFAAKDDEIYYYDSDASAIRKLNLTSVEPEPTDVINNVEAIWEMRIDGDILYMRLENGGSFSVGRVDLSIENPVIDIIATNDNFNAIDVENNTIFISMLSGGLATIDLTDETYAVVIKDDYFQDFLPPTSIKVSDNYVYYTSGGIVARIDLVSSEKEVLVQTNPNDNFTDIHVEEDFIIFTNPFEETIYKYDL